ncbi:MAG: hypothetical protein CMK64_04985 [Pseudoalteromonas sp.]|nr:hypothetical protein [Pseudoalteromonas sp.]|tara:strand:- start:7879 stop:8154 length:276 start_codon:yes stop_codon:yes gene_type:complete
MKYLSVLYIFTYLLFKEDINSFLGNEYISYVAYLVSIVISMVSSYYFKFVGVLGIFAMIYTKVASVRDFVEAQPIYEFTMKAISQLIEQAS